MLQLCCVLYLTILMFKVAGFILGQTSQPAFTCSKLIIETLEQGVKHF